MKYFLLISLSLVFSNVSFGEIIKIQLTDYDQWQLTKELSKIDLKYRSEELVDKDLPTWYLIKKYYFLDNTSPFYINCSEEFHNSSTIGTNGKCEVGFNYEAIGNEDIKVHDGFIPEFAIAELKGSNLTKDLYKTIGNGVSPSVSFTSKEQISFAHPSTGQKFNAFKLRIECKRDASYKEFTCQVGAVK